MNLNKLVFALLLLVSSHGATAHVFFKIEHSQYPQAKPSYLLGTMHLLCESSFAMPKAIQDVTAAVNQLIVEVDLTNVEDLRAAHNASFQQPADYLRKFLDADAYKQLAEQAEQQLHMPLHTLAPLRPMIIGSLFLAANLPCPGKTFSLDEHLVKQAATANKKIVGLESARWQLELFDQLDLAEQVNALHELATSQNTTRQEITRMATVYLSGNGQKLHDELMSQDDFMGAQTLFLDDRNKTWVQQLPELMVENPSLIAVGAGHLYGPNGLLKLLAAKGFEITPIPVRFATVESR